MLIMLPSATSRQVVYKAGVCLCVTDDPATDYWAVREELRMYNPEYCARPHIVALNKMDLQEAAHLQAEIAAEVLTMAHRIQVGHAPGHVHSICNGCGSMLAPRHIFNTLPCSTCSCFTACGSVPF